MLADKRAVLILGREHFAGVEDEIEHGDVRAQDHVGLDGFLDDFLIDVLAPAHSNLKSQSPSPLKTASSGF